MIAIPSQPAEAAHSHALARRAWAVSSAVASLVAAQDFRADPAALGEVCALADLARVEAQALAAVLHHPAPAAAPAFEPEAPARAALLAPMAAELMAALLADLEPPSAESGA